MLIIFCFKYKVKFEKTMLRITLGQRTLFHILFRKAENIPFILINVDHDQTILQMVSRRYEFNQWFKCSWCKWFMLQAPSYQRQTDRNDSIIQKKVFRRKLFLKSYLHSTQTLVVFLKLKLNL